MKIDPGSYILVALGGFIGSALRYYIDERITLLAGILIVNVIGCFFIGVFMYESIFIERFNRNARLFFGIGMIGSFTTFSAITVQSFVAGPLVGMTNILANLFLGLAAVYAGRIFVSYRRGI